MEDLRRVEPPIGIGLDLDKISTLPVMEGSRIEGIITESDIFHAFVELEGKN